MIEFRHGDVFEPGYTLRVNTINCRGAMGKGVALLFRNRFPRMYDDYRRACRDGLVRPGRLHTWLDPETGETVINFPTKDDWRDPSRYEYITSGLDALALYLARLRGPRVIIPPLGCGNGGLDWARVRPLIERRLGVAELDGAHVTSLIPNKLLVTPTHDDQPSPQPARRSVVVGHAAGTPPRAGADAPPRVAGRGSSAARPDYLRRSRDRRR